MGANVFEQWDAVEREKFIAKCAELKARADFQAHVDELRSTAVRRDAEKGVVIEGVAVRKPQPRLT